MNLSIIIPLHNAEKEVRALIRSLAAVSHSLKAKGAGTEIILVDDGSTDKTAVNIALEGQAIQRLTVLSHDSCRGTRQAFKSGFLAAKGDYILTCLAEESYRLREIPELVEKMSIDCDIVAASHYHPQGGCKGMPWGPYFLGRICSQLYSLALGCKLYTVDSYFRIYRREVIERIALGSRRAYGASELLARAIRAGFVAEEIPSLRQSSESYRFSKALAAGASHAGLLFRLFLGLVPRDKSGARSTGAA